MFNLPDIDRQTLAGAISTATHGTGLSLNTLSAYVTGLRLVTPAGKVMELDPTKEPALVRRRAGIARRARLHHRSAACATVPPYRLKKTTWIQPTEDVLKDFEAQAQAALALRDVPAHTFEVRERAGHRRHRRADSQPAVAAGSSRSVTTNLMRALILVPVPRVGAMIDAAVAATPPSEPVVDVSYRILSNVRNYRFNEMEYSVPLDAGAPCRARNSAHDRREEASTSCFRSSIATSRATTCGSACFPADRARRSRCIATRASTTGRTSTSSSRSSGNTAAVRTGARCTR